MQQLAQGRPLVFGEVLHDVFPDHVALGGTACNVAWHLHGFGVEPLLISAVGVDERGDAIQKKMEDWGMDMAGLQRDTEHQTGEVRVVMDGIHHTFEVLADQAYDFVDAETAYAVLPDNVSIVYPGTLGIRVARMQELFMTMKERVRAPSFVDVNIRKPWYDAERREVLLKDAYMVKVNDEELDEMMPGDQHLEERARTMRETYGIELLILTRGSDGATYVRKDGSLTRAPDEAVDVVDTVGGGDAFSAVTLLGALNGWDDEIALTRALAFATDVCRNPGAVFTDKRVYEKYAKMWGIARYQ